MTRDDIIRTAREAGLFVGTNISGVQLVGGVPSQAGGVLVHLDITELELFASMVAFAEREACAQVADVHARGWEMNPGANPNAGFIASSNCAAAIRARSNQ